MLNKRYLQLNELRPLATKVAEKLLALALTKQGHELRCFPVPRGGVPAYYLIREAFIRLTWRSYGPNTVTLTEVPVKAMADVFIDDLIDSGKTRQTYLINNPNAPFLALVNKEELYPGEWLVFPWEETEEKSIEDAFVRLLQYIGEDPNRGGLKETPDRMAKAWKFWTSGYGKEPASVIKQFEDGGQNYDEMIHVKGVPFYSHCEHHLAQFFGTVTFAYIPSKDNRIVGLSKIDRLIDIFARRLQVQERLTTQIVDSFCEVMRPLGAGVCVRARHLCIESRGVQHAGQVATTSAFRGVLLTKPEARAEFFSLER